eukprot:3623088-Alexandrium_andersonii.AAC.1
MERMSENLGALTRVLIKGASLRRTRRGVWARASASSGSWLEVGSARGPGFEAWPLMHGRTASAQALHPLPAASGGSPI